MREQRIFSCLTNLIGRYRLISYSVLGMSFLPSLDSGYLSWLSHSQTLNVSVVMAQSNTKSIDSGLLSHNALGIPLLPYHNNILRFLCSHTVSIYTLLCTRPPIPDLPTPLLKSSTQLVYPSPIFSDFGKFIAL